MAKDTYNKRMKGSWHQGKSCKGDGEERQYAKREIEQALKEDHEDYLVRHRGKRKHNVKAKLEYSIAWYIKVLEEHRGRSWWSSFTGYCREALKKAKKEYEEKFGSQSNT